jgi:O-antigen/teichoic acid export membrane protein
MLKRIFPIALLTGSGQLFSLFALKYISRFGTSLDLKAIGQTDSLVLFMLNGIALGLQTAAMRDLALAEDWKTDFQKAQSARFTLSLLFCTGSLLAFFNPYYFLFLFAPVLAMNGDYALYARSHPIAGASVSFSRLFLPYGAIMVTAHIRPELIIPVYIVSTVITYFLSNLFISGYLKTPAISQPSFKNLHLYIKSMPIGVEILSLYFIGMGLMMVIPYFYSNSIVALAFVGLKFYVLFKGVLRIIHQAFIREMNSFEVCLRVDQLCMLAGISFTVFMICFPKTVIGIFFGEKYLSDSVYFILLAIAGLIYSSFSSFIIRAMLERKDIPNAIAALASALFTICLNIVLSYLNPSAVSIGVSLIAGELAFAISMVFILHHKSLVRDRLVFFLKNIFIVAIPVLIAGLFGDHLKNLLIAFLLFGGLMAIVHYKKFAFGVRMA